MTGSNNGEIDNAALSPNINENNINDSIQIYDLTFVPSSLSSSLLSSFSSLLSSPLSSSLLSLSSQWYELSDEEDGGSI